MLTGSGAPDPGRLFAGIDFNSFPRVIAAISGGSDSTALLVLLDAYLRSAFPGALLVAATVDHGLREGSAAEARQVARLCADLGIRHVTLRWAGDKPSTGLPAAARAARYRLLAEAAEAEGARIIVTGHTADDQAETVLMRQARGAGRGLAGMAPAALHDGRIWIVRPLLDVRRDALRDVLRGRGIDWIDDPTNENSDFERVRLRARLTEPGIFEDAISSARAAAVVRKREGVRAAELIRAYGDCPAPGLIRLAPDFAQGVERDAAIYALRILLAVAGGRTYLPDAARSAALFERLAQPPSRATLSGAIAAVRPDGIYLLREARGLPAAGPARSGQNWDGRYRLEGEANAMDIAPLGPTTAARLASDIPAAPRALVRAALSVEPALWRDGRALGPLPADAAGGLRARRILAPWAGLLPCFDLAPARAVASLLGAEAPSDPPYAGHSDAAA